MIARLMLVAALAQCLACEDHASGSDPTQPKVAKEYDADGRVIPRQRTTEVPACISCHRRSR